MGCSVSSVNVRRGKEGGGRRRTEKQRGGGEGGVQSSTRVEPRVCPTERVMPPVTD